MEFDSEAMLSTIRDLVSIAPRATGTPGGAAAAAYVGRRFTAAGLHTSVLETPTFAWSAQEHELVIDGRSVPGSAIAHSGLAAHDEVGERVHDVTARVVDIGAGPVRGTDVRGAIVLFDLAFEMSLYHLLPLTRWIHDPGRRMLRHPVMRARNPYVTSLGRTMTAARAAGAAAVIGVLRDYPESTRYHNEYYRRTLFALPGMWITRDEGERVRAGLHAGSEATMRLHTTRRAVQATTVLGVLPGRSRETIMIQSHHDSVGPGAVEDASGTAEVIALAEHFAAAGRAQPEKTLLFVTFDTHFTGYHAHRDFATRHVLAADAPYDIVLNLTIEHVGRRAVRGADGGFQTIPETEPRGIFSSVSPGMTRHLIRGLRRHGLGATTLLDATLLEFSAHGIPTDASFTLVCGVPTVSLISGPLYLYDDADTVDQVDVEQLAPVAAYFADIVDEAQRRRGSRLGMIPRSLRRRLPRGRW